MEIDRSIDSQISLTSIYHRSLLLACGVARSEGSCCRGCSHRNYPGLFLLIHVLSELVQVPLLFVRGVAKLGRNADGTPINPPSIPAALAWMLLLPVLFFFLPVLGPYIGGWVGGRRAGGPLRALLAALIPSILFASIVYIIAQEMFGYGANHFAQWVLTASLAGTGPVLLGALIGGSMSGKPKETSAVPPAYYDLA